MNFNRIFNLIWLIKFFVAESSPVEETNIVIIKQEPRDALANNENNLDRMVFCLV